MLQLLQDRESLREIFASEFNSELPDKDQADILGWVENGEVQAFVVAEILIRAGLLWVKKELRNTPEASKMVKALCRKVQSGVLPGQSVITIAGNESEERLFKRLGMRKVEGTVYRIDV